ncbi:tRNA glutamyl-Q(34) synthetase GluQRS [Paracraurococcus lichenis]|uniref:tRNA glutamyl-Q(34) synthetase GluQRS n=1 Tax=Paracraurococcus lichenis TaxID=3064888 RepID=A0ABT9DTG6_9PROT|nr:tRNA glutamyl-Q(34) synthetase GluQRS [Paracraurococcus sp. LOR1-02]MDO9707192.1 tRNA glutamyl-Q(34) synthetase GluQRS [Paracraurococcus sp. LOR1-02]
MPATARLRHLFSESPPGAVTRFAPSPTGHLHLGHAHSALFAASLAEAAGGRFLLRLEDIDRSRCRPEFAAAIEEDLAWLGLAWDGPVRAQSAHMPAYRAALDRLAGRGLLYPCFCTRADIQREVAAAGHAPHLAPRGPDGPLYPGTCRRLSPAEREDRIAAGQPYALRLDMAAALAEAPPGLSFHELGEGRLRCDPGQFGDAVLARKDVPASYHLCVTHDDALQGVTLVTRGEDLRPATHLHRLLQALLEWPEPAYAHHPLILGPDGKRLAKREGAPALRALRAAGQAPAAVRAMAGWPPGVRPG